MCCPAKVVDKTFNADTKVDTANVDRREMQYLYHDGSGFVFMDTSTYDQVTIADETVRDTKDYLLEGQVATRPFTRALRFMLNCPLRSSWGSPIPSRVCRVTAALAAPSQPPSRPACRSRFRSS